MGGLVSRCEAFSSSAEQKLSQGRNTSMDEKTTQTKPSRRPWFWKRIERTELPNPGSYEDINQEASAVLRPNLFDGFRFDFNYPLSAMFSMGHSIEMGSLQKPPGYAFSANYLSNHLVMLSRVDLSGHVNGRVFINHSPFLTSKIVAETSSQPNESKATWDLDYRGSDFCGQLKFGNMGIVALSYLQSVTPNLSLGGEGFYQGATGFSAITAAGRYVTHDGVATCTIASFGPLVASYCHRVNPRVTLATEFFWDLRSRDSLVTIGYKFDLRQATVTGQIDTNGRVAALLEEKINPGLSFLLSGEIDHSRQEYKFGFGVTIGQ
ncbi:mitochondrial protein translocase, MPT family isoform 1 [Galdieria sulphuraria]|uniref:Mitochondrial protein translocase, MPT family isoform 1 n=1 Tax=Galdieria sulphuraria TaxID=130081 RepID=M2Y3Q1_GALSU|nr:mitochondrial protein translocase, MPT family isoform 2 [Galdieria sulphuraria]XP_005706965.1 mitochondrial protein translocase, MPT family isoform 1 [Galdieria sulphuraria]EME30444.1 mitochondrial protein translocase, MPT family isoform 2 [Galdieria sulphuraria]EME30445.1 mitochondrial protein translocase, MPT family isoform 1 [Galdieria sulphuraria]|eukprot:XP_005706964.1 mitochondrial protein translocase, MPT family isoform 2 [Galdieria sulphuraria]